MPLQCKAKNDKWLSVFGEMSVLNKHDDLKVYKHYKDIRNNGPHRGDFIYEQ